jgi:hypothetical protein
MPCRHLNQLFEVCREHSIKLSSTDLIRIVCRECGVSEECPSMLWDEYESRPTGETQNMATTSNKSDIESAKD